jgi:hypothetical protein
VAGGVGLAVLVALVVAFFASAKKQADYGQCAANLRLIDRALRTGDLFNSPRWDAAGTGRNFLTRPDLWPTRQHLPYDIACPVKGDTGEVDYRGPARLLRETAAEDPLVADRPGNHGLGRGGNVLLKRGDLFPCAESDPLWNRAGETTSD